MTAWGYPPEPDWVGQMEVKCSLTDLERKVITGEMERNLRILADGPVVSDPWSKSRSPEQVEELKQRIVARALADLIREWRRNDVLTFSCSFEGEAEVMLGQGHAVWDCPVCGEEHDDTSGPLVDPDPPLGRDLACDDVAPEQDCGA
jgi:hypothetical protein